jgi:alpha-glucosidase
MLALPGCAYLYQGEELGLDEVVDLPEALLQDPVWLRSGHTIRGRDGSRVPLPWSGTQPPFGFGPAGSRPWLPQPAAWAGLSVAAETGDPDSMLELYREALHIRREHPGFRDPALTWLDAPDGVLRFARADGLEALVNLTSEPIAVPDGRRLLLASVPCEDGRLPGDAAAWFG